jgi:dihydrofolate reductase
VYVAGGGEIYRQALPYADRLELTEVDQSPDGDVTFPTVDLTTWHESTRVPHDGFTFVTYTRR